jgi:hypothetical protein
MTCRPRTDTAALALVGRKAGQARVAQDEPNCPSGYAADILVMRTTVGT